MTLFNWLFGKSNASSLGPRTNSPDSVASQFSNHTRPPPGVRIDQGTAQPAVAVSVQRLEQRRTERNARRELLFQAVRESMVRVGVLSSSFKFKVLSLDQRGRSFLVMIELSAEFSGESEKLAEIENIIAQTARHRFDIMVQAVYWRYFNGSTSAASAPAPLLGAMHSPMSKPAPLYGLHGIPTSGASTSYSATTPTPRQSPALKPAPSTFQTSSVTTGSFPIIGATAAQKAAAPQVKAAADDLGDDEVAAFRRALVMGASQGSAAAPVSPFALASTAPTAKATTTPSAMAAALSATSTLDQARSKLLLTGYEDTEMHDEDPAPALSGTQYGELR